MSTISVQYSSCFPSTNFQNQCRHTMVRKLPTTGQEAGGSYPMSESQADKRDTKWHSESVDSVPGTTSRRTIDSTDNFSRFSDTSQCSSDTLTLYGERDLIVDLRNNTQHPANYGAKSRSTVALDCMSQIEKKLKLSPWRAMRERRKSWEDRYTPGKNPRVDAITFMQASGLDRSQAEIL